MFWFGGLCSVIQSDTYKSESLELWTHVFLLQTIITLLTFPPCTSGSFRSKRTERRGRR